MYVLKSATVTNHQDLCSVKFKFEAKSFLDVDPEKFQVVARSLGGGFKQRGGTGSSMGQGSACKGPAWGKGQRGRRKQWGCEDVQRSSYQKGFLNGRDNCGEDGSSYRLTRSRRLHEARAGFTQYVSLDLTLKYLSSEHILRCAQWPL